MATVKVGQDGQDPEEIVYWRGRHEYGEDAYMRKKLKWKPSEPDPLTFEERERSIAMSVLELKLMLVITEKKNPSPPKPILTDEQQLKKYDDDRARLRIEIERLEAAGEDYEFEVLKYSMATHFGNDLKKKIREKELKTNGDN